MGSPFDQRRSLKTDLSEKGYAVLCFMDDAEQANDYKAMLESNDIPTQVQENSDVDSEPGYTVLVPEEYLDEAHVVVESQTAYDDFYDFALDDEMDDFNDDSEDDLF
ncbi:hypothetical protein ACFL6U_27465 [Planctomycetota bacterium]